MQDGVSFKKKKLTYKLFLILVEASHGYQLPVESNKQFFTVFVLLPLWMYPQVFLLFSFISSCNAAKYQLASERKCKRTPHK